MNAMSKSEENSKSELVAPAGNIESFFASVEAGADAVYLGLKKFSARKLARNFTLEELDRVVRLAHQKGVKVYVALNSLVFPGEIPELIDTLAMVEKIGPDALIIQDPGVLYLVFNYFPGIRIHGSTLMAIHNSLGAQVLKKLGAKRVVLARELSLDEIRIIRENNEIELEVFVHGALCYSYSGLCLASSFLGGKSGLRGNCVQPCRRLYRSRGETGYFLSANDLSALEIIPQLKKIGVEALKLEGRMKPAEYVHQVVKAYRLVLDAPAGKEKDAIDEGLEILKEAPGRKPTLGYFSQGMKKVNSLDIVAPHRSGTSGIWVGTVNKRNRNQAVIKVRNPLEIGDRLRPESQSGKEKQAFVVKEIKRRGQKVKNAARGDVVVLQTGVSLEPGDKLFKVGSKNKSRWSSHSKLMKRLPGVDKRLFAEDPAMVEYCADVLMRLRDEESRWTKLGERSYLKISRVHLLSEAFRLPIDYVLLVATKENLEKISKRRFSQEQFERFGWILPPIILQKDVEYYENAILWYLDQGFTYWWINNWSHFKFFENRGVRLVADSGFNISNNVELWVFRNWGCKAAVLSWEMSKTEIVKLIRNKPPLPVYMTVYGYPPIFVSRILPPVKSSKISLEGDKRSTFYILNREGISVISPSWPVNLFDALDEIKSIGVRNFVIDCSHHNCDKKELTRVVSGYRRERTDLPRTRFNFEKLVA